MAAPTQTDANKGGASSFTSAEATSGVILIDFVGGVKCGVGTGTPNAYVTAPIGSFFIDVAGGNWYYNTDGSTTWALFSAMA